MTTRRRSSEKLNELLAPNKIIGSKYKIVGGRLGVGNFGIVRLGYEIRSKRRLNILSIQ